MAKTHHRRSSSSYTLYLPPNHVGVIEPGYVARTFQFGTSKCATLLREDVVLPPTLNQQQHQQPCTYHAFEIRHTGPKGTGLGMFARSSGGGIPAGGTVLVEHPLLVMPHRRGSFAIASLLEMVDPKGKTELMNLANAFPLEEKLGGIVRTNSLVGIEMGGGAEEEYRGVFLKLSRCNHSCSPNAHWTWDPASFSLTLEAVRPIAPHEEITIQYIDVCGSRAQRREELRMWFNFECVCPACSLPLHRQQRQSDFAREELARLMGHLRAVTFEEWCASGTLWDGYLIRMHRRALEIREREGLEMLEVRRHVDAIAVCYGALGDVEMFRLWGGKAREMRVGGGGERAVLDRWIEEPGVFPVWGWRRRVLMDSHTFNPSLKAVLR
ncbi:uncharacterized protein BT62DRAFT_921526 [Guyanagaster necrorhizus]|uniref:SET domain-containing protein n=1 Tax=Guyanagaster necrorhizus TaxID=856835 RepID=A0A9P7VNA0_9AGAR|nr:uncharacterized protein BT62DRAFT_921526 [Guyanagaster necrorhizus MCA 3950]KAG7443859.1 hypothetical protein BT62DRAFT_921526 [Guyanagaster necrorhizus MCA 3950]